MKFQNLHPWSLSVSQALEIQNILRDKIKLKRFRFDHGLIAGADVNFKDKKAIGAIVLLSFPELVLIEYVRGVTTIGYPYIPGLLTFREGPVLEKCFRNLKHQPDVIIFDGQGIAHPRNMGIATHMGILLDKPSIGCAKSWLWGRYKEPAEYRGAFSYIWHKSQKLGAVLRTKDKVKPVFVSPGYNIDIASSIDVVLRCSRGYRLPEVLRLAHYYSKI
ncbi:MAG: endonuclease V [Candidatus Omnitrophica bacterium]|nr:endonuclease V [Candidatus Omnitrophota bacterium]